MSPPEYVTDSSQFRDTQYNAPTNKDVAIMGKVGLGMVGMMAASFQQTIDPLGLMSLIGPEAGMSWPSAIKPLNTATLSLCQLYADAAASNVAGLSPDPLAIELREAVYEGQLDMWVLYNSMLEKLDSSTSANTAASKPKRAKEQILSATAIGGLGLVVGALIVVPPLSADMKWRSALSTNDLTQLKLALEPSYMTPTDTNRLLNMVSILENSKLPDVAYEYAKKGVEFNPESFDSWRTLYAVTNSTPADKELALSNMKRLDPKNSNPLNTPK
jgi:hypothetical protein